LSLETNQKVTVAKAKVQNCSGAIFPTTKPQIIAPAIDRVTIGLTTALVILLILSLPVNYSLGPIPYCGIENPFIWKPVMVSLRLNPVVLYLNDAVAG
jgi:hypothetical protein